MSLKPLADMLTLNPSPDGLIVISTIDIELLPRMHRGSKKDVRRLAGQVPDPSDLQRAFKAGGREAVIAVIREASTSPPSTWWCDEIAAADSVLQSISARLMRSPRPYGAYQTGIVGSIPWVQLWLD